MFKAVEQNGKFLGYSLARKDAFYFFGSREVRAEDLPGLFPRFEFCFLRQVHGALCLPADPGARPEADGHFTEESDRALVIQTADCLPLLLAAGDRICALHAGWKSVALNIVRSFPAEFAAIGPHIGPQSFELGLDVAARLNQTAPRPANYSVPSHNQGKVLFDLQALVRAQLLELSPAVTFAACADDTLTDERFYSYRRDRQQAGRQVSFVVRPRDPGPEL